MHTSQSSDSAPDAEGPCPSTTPPDQDPVMPPTSPPNDQIPSPSTISAQPLQASPSEQEDQQPASPQPPSEPAPDPRPTAPASDTPSTPAEQTPAEQTPAEQTPAEQTPAEQTPAAPPPPPQPPQPPVQPKEENVPPQPIPVAPPRRVQRQRGRPGRPPNINENSLMRRLECVMAVESGRMTMLTACQQYDISARTFYRWLRNKDRLIELTGFTEEDFKNGNPPVSKQTMEMQDSARMPAQRTEQDNNLPRLPNQPIVTTPENRPRDPQPAPAASPQELAGSKRRFPKSAEPNRELPQQGTERFPSPNANYFRRNFTKMPSLGQFARDQIAGPSEQQAAARNATRMRRDSWPDQPNVEYGRTDERGFPAQYTESPPNMYKRRKVVRPGSQGDDTSEPLLISPQGDQPTEDRAIEETPFVNGNSTHHQEAIERVHVPREGVPPEAVMQGKTIIVNGPRPTREVVVSEALYDPRIPRKHRIEVMMGRRKVTLAWYDGTATEDIKASIARRFALLPETQWALVDQDYDEIIISDGLPSGRYTLTVLS